MLVNAHDHLSHYHSLDEALREIERLEMTTLAVSESVQDYKSIPDHPLILKGIGIHPWQVTPETSLQGLEEYILDCDFIGEIGLDYYWAKDQSAYPKQREVFEFLLQMAKAHHKITNIHTKGAEGEVLQLLKHYQLHGQIIHWYSGPLELLDEYLALDCFFTISVDAGHSELTDAIIDRIPHDRLLFETDGPGALEWVTGEPSWPEDILRIRQYVAERKGLNLTEVDSGSRKLMALLK
ncbi:TatD family hydrolase [Aerococcaceae bacterium DSM 111176]|nr:TatD family hydrolase [Aerococcaceae bacterium DSM 111176]